MLDKSSRTKEGAVCLLEASDLIYFRSTNYLSEEELLVFVKQQIIVILKRKCAVSEEEIFLKVEKNILRIGTYK